MEYFEVLDERVREQFRLDTNCSRECEETYAVCINESKNVEGSRRVEGLSDFFKAIIYKDYAYIMADKQILEWTREKYQKYKMEWFCKFENLRALDKKLFEYNHRIFDTHIYYLPDPDATEFEFDLEGITDEDNSLEVILMDESAINKLVKSEGFDRNSFIHALPGSKTQPDVIAAALKFNGKIVAIAGASKDSVDFRQIGVDVLPDFQGAGLGVYLVTMLKNQIIENGQIPYYGTSESHSISRLLAVRSGFVPAWCEVFSKEI